MRIVKSRIKLHVLGLLTLCAVPVLSAQTKQPDKGAPAVRRAAAKPQGVSKPGQMSPTGQAPQTSSLEKPTRAIVRRDPFQPLVSKQRLGSDIPERLPPGKAGLVISSLRIDGVVRGPNGMIAVVSNPQQRVYFLREGDQLFDGRVEKITMEAVSFHQTGKDAFGKPVERQVSKRLYPSPGEQP